MDVEAQREHIEKFRSDCERRSQERGLSDIEHVVVSLPACASDLGLPMACLTYGGEIRQVLGEERFFECSREDALDIIRKMGVSAHEEDLLPDADDPSPERWELVELDPTTYELRELVGGLTLRFLKRWVRWLERREARRRYLAGVMLSPEALRQLRPTRESQPSISPQDARRAAGLDPFPGDETAGEEERRLGRS